jgi:hypothetical protein
VTWGDIKKGDEVTLVGFRKHESRYTAVSVGRKWITLDPYGWRFDAETGRGERGQIHTEYTLADSNRAANEAMRRHALVKRIRERVGVRTPLVVLEAIDRLCDEAGS